MENDKKYIEDYKKRKVVPTRLKYEDYYKDGTSLKKKYIEDYKKELPQGKVIYSKTKWTRKSDKKEKYVDLDQQTISKTGGKKNDKNKLRYDLFLWDVSDDIVDIMTYGANKYGDNNWQEVPTNKHFAAGIRHISKYKQGEGYDEESGKHHLAHALCDFYFVLWQIKNDHIILDD